MPDSVTLRFAFPDDAIALERLASLDSAPLPAEPLLLAEVAGELRAALSLHDGAVIADPFHRTAELVALLRERAGQLRDWPSGSTAPHRIANPVRAGASRLAATLISPAYAAVRTRRRL